MTQADLYDAVNPLNIDPNVAPVVAGYLDGPVSKWPASAWLRFPNARQVLIAVFASDNEGDVLDVESGDATPDQAPGWVSARRAAGHTWPTVYCNKSTLPAVIAAFEAQGVPAPFWWIADWPSTPPGSGTPHVDQNCVATQYDHDLPPGYDISLVADLDVWPPVAPGVRGTTAPAAPVVLPPVPPPPSSPPATPAPATAAPPFPGVDLIYVPGHPIQHNAECQQWQARMIARGWNLGRTGADGFYGPVTEGACLHFQQQKGLKVDGIVGPQTWAAAWELPVTPN